MRTRSPKSNPIAQHPGSLPKGRARIPHLALALVLLALALRAQQLAQESLWLDEAFSVWISDQRLPDLLSWTVQIDQHPPLYYLVLRAWVQLGGSHSSPAARAFWIRLPSAFLSTLSIAVIYALGRRLAGPKAGLLAALLLALSPFHVWFAQEARMYALLTLNVSLAMLGLVRLLTPPPLSPPRTNHGGDKESRSLAKPTGMGEKSRSLAKPTGMGEKSRSLAKPTRMGEKSRAPARRRRFFLPPVNCTGGIEGGRARFLSPVQPTLMQRIGGRRGTEGRAGPAWALYILFTAATLWTHNTALLFGAATNLFVLSWICLSRKPETGFCPTGRGEGQNPVSLSLKHWLLAQLAILLLWSPWLRPFLRQAAGVDREFWLPAPTWATLGDTLNTFLSAFLPPHLAWRGTAWLACGVLLLSGIYAMRKRPAHLALLATLLLTPLLGELLVSLRRPIFYTRTLIWATLPFYLLLAIGAAALGKQRRGRRHIGLASLFAVRLALALLLAANARSLHNYYTNDQKEAWNQAAQYVSQHVQPGDLILFNASWVQLPFDFYFTPPLPTVEHGLPVDLFDRGILEPKMTRQDLPYLQALLQGHTRVWLVYSHNWYTDPQGLIPDALAQQRRLVDRQHFRGIEIYRYHPES